MPNPEVRTYPRGDTVENTILYKKSVWNVAAECRVGDGADKQLLLKWYLLTLSYYVNQNEKSGEAQSFSIKRHGEGEKASSVDAIGERISEEVSGFIDADFGSATPEQRESIVHQIMESVEACVSAAGVEMYDTDYDAQQAREYAE